MNWKNISLLAVIAVASSALAVEKPRVVVSVPCAHLTETECERAGSLADRFVPALVDASSARLSFQVARECTSGGGWNSVRSCYFDALLRIGAKGLGDKSPDSADAVLLLLFAPGEGIDGSVHGIAYLIPRLDTWAESQFTLRPIPGPGRAQPRWLIDAGALPKHLADQKLASSLRRRGEFVSGTNGALFGHALLVDP